MPGEAAGGAQQHLAIFRVAFPVEAEQGEFVPLHDGARRTLVVAIDKVFHTRVERAGDARQVAGDLPGAPGLPLRDGAAGDPDALRELILAEALFTPQGFDPGADIEGRAHGC